MNFVNNGRSFVRNEVYENVTGPFETVVEGCGCNGTGSTIVTTYNITIDDVVYVANANYITIVPAEGTASPNLYDDRTPNERIADIAKNTPPTVATDLPNPEAQYAKMKAATTFDLRKR